MNIVDVKAMALDALKILAYDQQREALRIQSNLRVIEAEIQSREVAALKKAEPKTGEPTAEEIKGEEKK